MVRKVFFAISLVLAGFLMGGAAFMYLKPTGLLSPKPQPTHAPQTRATSAWSFSDTITSTFPSVVNISTVKDETMGGEGDEGEFFDLFDDLMLPPEEQRPRHLKSQASGVLASEDGYIITSFHVVADVQRIKVTLYDQRVFTGRVVGVDSKTDLAVVKIDAGGLPVLPWADSDTLQPGDVVLAVGNPFGLAHTATMGIISAVGRANVGIADYEDFIQTDAAINPGNSGGPLIDAQGNVVGINTAIFSKNGGYQGIGFAVPSNMARQIVDQLVQKGRVVRGWLGVSIQDLTPELARSFGLDRARGALVSEPLPGSPALKAGIRSGDIIISFDGKPVAGSSELRNMAARTAPGARVPLEVFRKGSTLRLISAIEPLPGDAPQQEISAPEAQSEDLLQGFEVMALTKDIAQQLNHNPALGGVVVGAVKPTSPADEGGLRRGDLILEIDGQRVRGMEDFRRAAEATHLKPSVLMFVKRGDRKVYLTMESPN